MVHIIRVDAAAGEVTCDHEPLNVVGVCVVEGLADGMLKAAHACFPGPKPRRKLPIVLEEVEVRILGMWAQYTPRMYSLHPRI